MNNEVINLLGLNHKTLPLTLDEIMVVLEAWLPRTSHLEYEIMFYQDYYHKVETPNNCNHPGPTTNFNIESRRGSIRPCGIKDQSHINIIRRVCQLECSLLAQTHILLYRGAKLSEDDVIRNNSIYSLSFGTSLFAGIFYDGAATAFHFIRNDNCDAYCIPILYKKIEQSCFYIPQDNTICQLFGKGEVFHARTKLHDDFNNKSCPGIYCFYNWDKIPTIRSNLSRVTKLRFVTLCRMQSKITN